MSEGKGKLVLIELKYDEASRSIVANAMTRYSGVDNVIVSTITNTATIIQMIHFLSKQSKQNLNEMIESGLVKIDDSLLNKDGIIVIGPDGEYHKYVIRTSTLEEIALTDEEKASLGMDTGSRAEPAIDSTDEPVVDTPEDAAVSEPEATDEAAVVSEDGATDAVVSDATDEPAKDDEEKPVRNFTMAKRGFALIGVAALIFLGSYFAKKKTGEAPKVPTGEIPIENTYEGEEMAQEESSSMEARLANDSDSVFEAPAYEEAVEVPAGEVLASEEPNYGEETYHSDIEAQTQLINDVCGSYQECDLEWFVDESDKMTIRAISNARNRVLKNLNNEYEKTRLMDDYVKYIFEEKTMFDGNVVKTYDNLSSFSKYVVIVSSQTMLPLCEEYNYSIGDHEYTTSGLDEKLHGEFQNVCHELNLSGKIY